MHKFTVNIKTIKYTFSLIFILFGLLSLISVISGNAFVFLPNIDKVLSGLSGSLKIFLPLFVLYFGIIILLKNKKRHFIYFITLFLGYLLVLSVINLLTNIRLYSTNEVMTLYDLINRASKNSNHIDSGLDFSKAFNFMYNLSSNKPYYAQAGGALGIVFSLPLVNLFGTTFTTILLSLFIIALCLLLFKYIYSKTNLINSKKIYTVGPYQFTNKREYEEYLAYLQNWRIQNQQVPQNGDVIYENSLIQDNTMSQDTDFSNMGKQQDSNIYVPEEPIIINNVLPKGRKKKSKVKDKINNNENSSNSINLDNNKINELMDDENKRKIKERNEKAKVEELQSQFTLKNVDNKKTNTINNIQQRSLFSRNETGKRFDDMIPDTNLLSVDDNQESKKEITITPYLFPKAELLENPLNISEDYSMEDMQNSKIIEETLESFKIPSKVVRIRRGPAVTRFEVDIASGIKVNKVVNSAENLALKLSSQNGVRIEAPVPGTTYIGIEIPNKKITPVSFKEVLFSKEMKETTEPLAIALGKDIAGKPIICNLEKMPHLLIAGATGSGKSVCINSIIMSLIFRCSPDECRLILIDPKFVELSRYNVLPHLLVPVVNETAKASGALSWAVAEMNDRYNMFKNYGVSNIKEYNKLVSDKELKLPRIVIIIDEMADLMVSTSKKEVEYNVNRLAALARAAGLHLVVATQRPSVNVITGVIKSNLPSRIAFASSSAVDSRTILDRQGAENLLGNGDMLYLPIGIMNPIRVQGCFVKNNEINTVIEYIKKNSTTNFDETAREAVENAYKAENQEQIDNNVATTSIDNDSVDALLEEAIDMVLSDGQASISMLQRRLSIGYARAGRLIDTMAKYGIISQSSGPKAREVLMNREQFEQIRDQIL